MKPPWILPAAVALTGACRIGGPSADPGASVTFPSDAADAPNEATGGSTGASGDDGSIAFVPPDAGAMEVGSVDSSTETGAAEGATGSDGSDALGHDGASDVATDTSACMSPATIPTCNPVTNTGCLLGPCDVSTTATTPTGACVFGSGTLGGEGATCTQSAGLTTCQAKLTCFGGSCRKVCFCDTDCPSGECCTDSDGTTGFKLCRACP